MGETKDKKENLGSTGKPWITPEEGKKESMVEMICGKDIMTHTASVWCLSLRPSVCLSVCLFIFFPTLPRLPQQCHNNNS